MMVHLSCEGITKKYAEKAVVSDVSIRVDTGKVVGLLGPNGAGKTTTFYMLCGLLSADEGRVFLDGLEVTNSPMFYRARLGLGYLPQESSVFRGLSVAQNIKSVLELSLIHI